MNLHPVIISVAPVGHDELPGPRTPREIAQEVLECYEAGARIAHLHVRDENGRQSAETGIFTETLELIRERCDILIEGSTGGPAEQSFAERSVSLGADVDLASLNMGSVNFFGGVYINLPSELRKWTAEMKAKRIVPNCCAFDLSMLYTLRRLREEGLIEEPVWVSFSLGFPDALPGDPDTLDALRRFVPPDAHWTLLHHHHPDLSLHAAALGLGGHVRVGFEDSHQIGPGRTARRNSELVAAVADLARLSGRQIATPDEVAALLSRRQR